MNAVQSLRVLQLVYKYDFIVSVFINDKVQLRKLWEDDNEWWAHKNSGTGVQVSLWITTITWKELGKSQVPLAITKRRKRMSFMVIRAQRWKNIKQNRDKFFSVTGTAYFSMFYLRFWSTSNSYYHSEHVRCLMTSSNTNSPFIC